MIRYNVSTAPPPPCEHTGGPSVLAELVDGKPRCFWCHVDLTGCLVWPLSGELTHHTDLEFNPS